MIGESAQYEDLKELVMGKALGYGIARKVGVFSPDPTLVIKCALNDPEQNWIEWRIWQEISEVKHLSKWFAPCVSISTCGMFLLQKRVEMGKKADYPATVPSFFTDLKYSNYGFLNGQLVCCDYGSFIVTNGLSAKLKKADWWE